MKGPTSSCGPAGMWRYLDDLDDLYDLYMATRDSAKYVVIANKSLISRWNYCRNNYRQADNNPTRSSVAK